MSSPRSSVNVGARTPGGPNGSTGWQVLDVAFGFFVWAIHFLVLYVATAVVCTLQPGKASAGARTAFLAALALVTLLAAAVVTWHALQRHRRWKDLPGEQTCMAVTIGCDVIALVAIAWQFFPIGLVPPCV